VTAVIIPMPKEGRGGDLREPPFAPVAAVAHIANARPGLASAAHDGWPPAYPDWDDLTAAEQEEHRQTCASLCRLCEAHRAFGECSSCGGETEAIGPDELSRCCGSRVILGPEAA
jgi:hypothetical protein